MQQSRRDWPPALAQVAHRLSLDLAPPILVTMTGPYCNFFILQVEIIRIEPRPIEIAPP